MQEQFLQLEGPINSAGTVPTLGGTDLKCRNSSYTWKDPSIVQEQFLHLEGPIQSAGTVPTLGRTINSAGTVPTLGRTINSAGTVLTFGGIDPKCRNSSKDLFKCRNS